MSKTNKGFTETPLVSVIVPVYNIDLHIDSCIRSVLNQDYREIELIIVNDGSTDDTGLICERWAHKDPRIQVLHQSNTGVSQARNNGIHISNGKYILFVDGDDNVHHQMISSLLSLAVENANVDIVSSNIDRYTKKYNPYKKLKQHNIKTLSSRESLKELMYQKIPNGPVAKLYKQTLFKNIRFPEGVTLGEDLLVNINLFQKANSIIITPQALYGYYQRAESASQRDTPLERLVLIQRLEQKLIHYKSDPDISKALHSRIFAEAMYISIWSYGRRSKYSSINRSANLKVSANIKSYRKSILSNRRTSHSLKLYALLSLTSPQLPKIIYYLLSQARGKYFRRTLNLS